ncbi:hypothetical protein [Alteromonas sp. P256]|uniref:hypothetical protein n=1 Tax=Alteromonas sp. P256 TaxID=3117399 RepID=UPI002FE15D60
MRNFLSYIIALTVFFIASSSVGELFSSYDDKGNVDVKGIFIAITVGMLAAYYTGKWFSDKFVPYHIYITFPICAILVLGYYLHQKFGYSSLLSKPWFQIYILGILSAVLTSVVSFIWKKLTEHISGEAAINKQIRRLFQTSKSNIYTRHGVPFVLTLHSLFVLTSWICVILNIIDILGATYALSKILLRSESEQFKRIKMPLINNKSLSNEKAWALLSAYAITMGASVDKDDLIADLENVSRVHVNFDFDRALNELQFMSVISSDIVESTRAHFEPT